MEKRKIEWIAPAALSILFLLLLISPSYAVDVVSILTVKNPLPTILSITGNNGTEIFNPQVFAISPDPGDSDVNYTLWRNNQLINSSFGPANLYDNSILTAGTYTYVFNNTAGKNYTQNETGTTLIILISPNSTSAPTATQSVNPVGVGGYFGCKKEDYYCSPTQQCCAGLACQNNICVNISTNSSTTTATVPNTTTPAATVPAPNTTATIAPSPISSPINGFMVFASSPLGISLLLSLVAATVLVIIFYKKRYNKENPEEKKSTTF